MEGQFRELAFCCIWKTLPSVLMEGAMIISAWWHVLDGQGATHGP